MESDPDQKEQLCLQHCKDLERDLTAKYAELIKAFCQENWSGMTPEMAEVSRTTITAQPDPLRRRASQPPSSLFEAA